MAPRHRLCSRGATGFYWSPRQQLGVRMHVHVAVWVPLCSKMERGLRRQLTLVTDVIYISAWICLSNGCGHFSST